MNQELTISLDVWNTLIQYNPECGKHRYSELSKLLGVDEAVVVEKYRDLKTYADSKAEEHGLCQSQKHIYTELLSCSTTKDLYWFDVRDVVQRVFIKYPPLIHPAMTCVLYKIQMCLLDRKQINVEFGIASNNNFISGDVINQTVLRHFRNDFAFQVHSTDVECAKPSINFIKHVVSKSGRSPDNIVHIGDNPVCDNFSPHVQSVIIKNPANCLQYLAKEYL